MNLGVCLRACLACLMLPAVCLAMDPLPRADLTSVKASITAPLQGLMDDYLNLLPSQTSFSSFADDGVSLRSWSSNKESLSRACYDDQSACAPALQAQFDKLMEEWSHRDPQRLLSVRDAAEVSALTDLCLVGFQDMGYRCLPRQKREAPVIASIIWRSLGYEHLFLEYGKTGNLERDFYRSWLEKANLSPEETRRQLKELEPDQGASERDAYSFELQDYLSGAFDQWAATMQQENKRSNN